jgi:hypothetical protein
VSARDLILDELANRVNDPVRRQQLAELGAQVADLSIRKLAGLDVEADLRHLHAQAMLITSAEAAGISIAVNRVIAATVSTVLASIGRM